MSLPVTRLVSAACLVAALGACAAEEDLGTVDLNLVGQAPSGAVYVLRHAEITVAGDGSPRVFHTDDDVEATRLSAEVATGAYTATLSPGWQLLRRTSAGETVVDASLISPNPAAFSVTANASTSVVLRFSVSSEVVPLEHGSFDISVAVEEHHQATIGYREPLPSSEQWSGGYLFAQSVDIAVPSRLRRFGFIGGHNNTECGFGLYSDDAGAPDALVTELARSTVSGGIAFVTNDIALPAGRYWIAAACSSEVTFRAAVARDTTFRYVPYTPGSALPATFGSSQALVSAALNFYLVVETP